MKRQADNQITKDGGDDDGSGDEVCLLQWPCIRCKVIDAFVFQGGERGLKKAPEAELARRTYVNCVFKRDCGLTILSIRPLPTRNKPVQSAFTMPAATVRNP